MQAPYQAVVARDDVRQFVALAPRGQQLGLTRGVELQEGCPQLQQGPDQPATLHQGEQQGHHDQAERQHAEHGGQLPVHGLTGGGELFAQLLPRLQQLGDVLLHHLTSGLLLLQRLAAVFQLLGIALEQGGQLGFGLIPELLAYRLSQGEFVGRCLLEKLHARQGGQGVGLLLQGSQLELQPFETLGARLLHVVLALVGEGGEGGQDVGRPLAILLGQDRIPPGGCSLLAVTEQGFGLGGQLVLGILQQPLAVAGELARRQIVAVNAGFHLLKPGV